MAMARCLLKARDVPSTFWGEAVSTAVFILNRLPTKALRDKTPYEAWHGVKPAVHFMRTFGCVVHVKVTRPHAAKLDDRSVKMVFIGYEPGSKGYRVYDPASGRLHITRDAVFDEAKGWNWDHSGSDAVPDTFTVEYTVDVTLPEEPVSPTTSQCAAANMEEPHTPPAAGSLNPDITFASPPSHISSDIDLDGEGAPRRFRMVDDCINTSEPVEFDPDELLLAASEEPNTFEQANIDPAWRAAMREELTAIVDNGTWTMVDLPPGQRPIGLKWVFKLKKDATGAVVHHKARLVAKGYIQRAGVDFDEVFAPVARLDSVRALVAVAAHEGWNVHHLDVKSAFLNGDLEEEVYVAQPPGFTMAGRERQVLRLSKALYGLRQAPRAWNSKLNRTLVALGFTRCVEEHGVYTRGQGHKRVLLGVYVDNLIVTGADEAEVKAFKMEMQNSFKMSDLGYLSYYLGIEVKQEQGKTTVSQAAYTSKLMEKAGMTDCNAVHVPMEHRLKLSKDSSSPPTDTTHYRSLVGSLRYLVHTRPDIAFAVGYVSQFLEKPTTEHLSAVKHILRYIAGTPHYGLCYTKGQGRIELKGYSDADFSGDVDDHKSTTGVLFCLGGVPVSWQSQKQPVVTLSSCEAEYIVATAAACQGIWLGRLLGRFYGKTASTTTIFIDNQSTIQLCKNPVFHSRSKHIARRFHFIRERVDDGEVTVRKIHTDDQLADILTKSLGRIRFLLLRSKIGVVDTNLVQLIVGRGMARPVVAVLLHVPGGLATQSRVSGKAGVRSVHRRHSTRVRWAWSGARGPSSRLPRPTRKEQQSQAAASTATRPRKTGQQNCKQDQSNEQGDAGRQITASHAHRLGPTRNGMANLEILAIQTLHVHEPILALKASMAAAAVTLVDDLVDEILLRLPPFDPASLLRAALVCKSWRHVLSDACFRRRLREFHRGPPLLGLLCNLSDHAASFVPTTMSPFRGRRFVLSPASNPRPPRRPIGWLAIDTRHGRVLLHTDPHGTVQRGFIMWSYPCYHHWPPDNNGGCDRLGCRHGPSFVVYVGSIAARSRVGTNAWSEIITSKIRYECFMTVPGALYLWSREAGFHDDHAAGWTQIRVIELDKLLPTGHFSPLTLTLGDSLNSPASSLGGDSGGTQAATASSLPSALFPASPLPEPATGGPCGGKDGGDAAASPLPCPLPSPLPTLRTLTLGHLDEVAGGRRAADLPCLRLPFIFVSSIDRVWSLGLHPAATTSSVKQKRSEWPADLRATLGAPSLTGSLPGACFVLYRKSVNTDIGVPSIPFIMLGFAEGADTVLRYSSSSATLSSTSLCRRRSLSLSSPFFRALSLFLPPTPLDDYVVVLVGHGCLEDSAIFLGMLVGGAGKKWPSELSSQLLFQFVMLDLGALFTLYILIHLPDSCLPIQAELASFGWLATAAPALVKLPAAVSPAVAVDFVRCSTEYPRVWEMVSADCSAASAYIHIVLQLRLHPRHREQLLSGRSASDLAHAGAPASRAKQLATEFDIGMTNS
nr:unnamed protein product [Digitaria exilis]